MDLGFFLDVPLPAAMLWPLIADLPRFACIDPFHTRVVPLRPVLAPGVDLALEHTVFGFRFLRFGRLLEWREGEGYSFSDLSARGSKRGFPHVFTIHLEARRHAPSERCRLGVRVKGKWTASWMPRFLARSWLLCVCRAHSRRLRRALEEFCRWT